jgi:hypothetical protein
MSDSGRPQGNNVEAEKIRSQQKCLHISLKPEIAKLCEILLLPVCYLFYVISFTFYLFVLLLPFFVDKNTLHLPDCSGMMKYDL